MAEEDRVTAIPNMYRDFRDVLDIWCLRYASGQTDKWNRQTFRHVDHVNISHPCRGCSKTAVGRGSYKIAFFWTFKSRSNVCAVSVCITRQYNAILLVVTAKISKYAAELFFSCQITNTMQWTMWMRHRHVPPCRPTRRQLMIECLCLRACQRLCKQQSVGVN